MPADQWRLSAQLGMGARAGFRLVEWPAMRAALPGVAGLVFMLCVTSFTIVLTLGGGPARHARWKSPSTRRCASISTRPGRWR